MNGRILTLGVALTLAVACNKETTSQHSPSSTPAAPEVRPVPAAVSVAASGSAAEETSPSPAAPATGSESQRREAVLGLIGGQSQAEQLPAVATEPGEMLNPSLRPALETSPRGRIRFGRLSVTGDQIPEVIQRIIRREYTKVRACYDPGLTRNPKLEGRVTLRLSIDKNGNTFNVQSSGSDLPDPQVVECIVRMMRGLKFPDSQGGSRTTAVVPLILTPD